MSTLNALKAMDLEFSGADLDRLASINPQTANEEFLLTLVDKFFYRVARLQDDVRELTHILEVAGG